jgi:hypothetical protein
MLNRPMLFAVLALAIVAAATAAGPAQPDLEVEGFSDPPANADACTGTSAGLPAAECSAWQDLFDGTGGTGSGVRNATVGVIVQCALPRLTD